MRHSRRERRAPGSGTSVPRDGSWLSSPEYSWLFTPFHHQYKELYRANREQIICHYCKIEKFQKKRCLAHDNFPQRSRGMNKTNIISPRVEKISLITAGDQVPRVREKSRACLPGLSGTGEITNRVTIHHTDSAASEHNHRLQSKKGSYWTSPSCDCYSAVRYFSSIILLVARNLPAWIR